MSKHKLKVHRTNVDNLISNLRGEIGEIVSSWVLYKDLMLIIYKTRSSDPLDNKKNLGLNRLFILTEKLTDEIVARLSELAERKIGRLTFYFASVKLKALEEETNNYIKYIQYSGFEKKRNSDISHKELPEEWSDHKYLHIESRIILKGIAHAVHLMKKYDSLHLGPSAKYLWYESRKRRYDLTTPPKVGYLLLPYLRLSIEIRIKLTLEEIKNGMSNWDDIFCEINGKKVFVKVNRKWGVVHLGKVFLVTPEYPIIELKSIAFENTKEN